MKTEHNNWKVLPLFTIAAVAAILSSGFSKVVSAQKWATSEQTIEERLLKVREQLQQKNAYNFALSQQNNPKMQGKRTFLSQFPPPWPNGPWRDAPPWPNGPWRDAPPWPNGPWRDAPPMPPGPWRDAPPMPPGPWRDAPPWLNGARFTENKSYDSSSQLDGI